MSKGKGDNVNFKRFWWRGSDSTRKELAKLAIDLDTTWEKLAGIILADVISKVRGDPDALRKMLGRK
jgi:hypothetical protein